MVRDTTLFTALSAIGVGASVVHAQGEKPFTVFLTGQANATSEVQQVPGYDYREPYPGNPIDGWTVSWGVANRPINGSASWTASGISFSPPEALSAFDTDETWATCGAHVFIDGSKGLQDVDSLCKGIISDSCQKALLARVKKSQICFQEDAIPKECANDFAGHRVEPIDMHGTYASIGFNHDTIHAPDNFTLYDSLLNTVALTFLGYKQNPDEAGEGDGANGPLLEGFLSCLKATNIKEGSRTLDNKEGSSNTDGAAGSQTTPPAAGGASTLQSSSIGVAAFVALVAAIL